MSKQVVNTNPRSANLNRKSEVVSKHGAALRVEVFKLTEEEKEGLSLKGPLSDIKIYSDEEWKRIKKAA